MNINGNITNTCDRCKCAKLLGTNNQNEQMYGCTKRIGRCPTVEERLQVEERKQDRQESHTGNSSYREYLLSRFMEKK